MTDPTHQPAARPSAPPPELLLAAIIDSSDDMILSQDLADIILTWNSSAERILGFTADEMIGRPCQNLLPPELRAAETALLERVKQGQHVQHSETVFLCKSGKSIDVSVTLSPVRDKSGRVAGVSKVARDISERKKGEATDALLAAIVNSSDDAIVSKNVNSIITSWNAGAERMFGYKADEVIGRSVLLLLPGDRQDEEVEIITRLKRGERVDHFETLRVRKNGEVFPVSLTISPVRDREGRIVGASKIARDITNLKRATVEREQLLASERAARTQAEHANRMKDEFLATISHELRTPLNAIVGWAEVLKTVSDNPAEIMNGVAVIERNARIQAQLIDDLLDLGRIAAGKMTLNIEPVDIAAIVREAIASVQHAADLKHITIKTMLPEARGWLMGDVKRLQQVVWNLLANAIKFTPANGRVDIVARRTNSHLRITVTDTGRGIDQDFLPYVFDRFRQADASITRQHGGLGIGLSLVKQLVELHAGTVKAESAGPGKGATFTVHLPLAAVHAETTDAGSADAPIGAESNLPGAVDLGGVKVLAVDDDRDSLELLRRILSARNADIRTAASVKQALEVFREFEPDVLLSDIGMPDSDGYDLIRKIRDLPQGETVPAAALTALARAEDRMRALQAGYQTHVSKPVAAAEIVAVVRSLASLRMGRKGPNHPGPGGPRRLDAGGSGGR